MERTRTRLAMGWLGAFIAGLSAWALVIWAADTLAHMLGV